jgi:hypothetical protein
LATAVFAEGCRWATVGITCPLTTSDTARLSVHLPSMRPTCSNLKAHPPTAQPHLTFLIWNVPSPTPDPRPRPRVFESATSTPLTLPLTTSPTRLGVHSPSMLPTCSNHMAHPPATQISPHLPYMERPLTPHQTEAPCTQPTNTTMHPTHCLARAHAINIVSRALAPQSLRPAHFLVCKQIADIQCTSYCLLRAVLPKHFLNTS